MILLLVGSSVAWGGLLPEAPTSVGASAAPSSEGGGAEPPRSATPETAVAPAPLRTAVSLAEDARSLNPSVASAELAALALSRLLDDPTQAPEARVALRRLLVELPARGSWVDLYSRLLDDADASSQNGLRLARATAWLHGEESAAWAREDLIALARALPEDSLDRPRAERLLVLAQARGGEGGVDAVRAAWSDAPGGPGGVDDPAVAALLIYAGAPEIARTSRSPGACAGLHTPAPCAEHLAELGASALAEALAVRADGAEGAVARARVAAAARDRARAMRAWVEVARLGPADVGLRAATARALLGFGDDTRAAPLVDPRWLDLSAELGAVSRVRLIPDDPAVLASALDAAPSNAWLRERRARARLEEGHADEALAELVALAEADDALVGPVVAAAWRARRPEAALATVRGALARARHPVEAAPLVRPLAELLAGAADARAATDPEDAERMARLALALEPAAVSARLLLAGRAWSAGDRDAALGHYRAAHAAAPDDPGVTRALVRLLGQTQRWDEARSVLRDEAGRARLDVLRALSEAADGRALAGADEARLEAAATAYAEDGEIAQALGDALLAGGRAAGAVRAYERAHALAPDDPWPLVGLANALLLRGSAEDLARVEPLLPVLADMPGDAVARRTRELRLRWLRAGATAAMDTGLDRRAHEAYVALLAEDTGSSVRARLGEFYLAHWQYAEAEACFRSALMRVPVDETAWAGLARTRMATGDFRGAAAVIAYGSVAEMRGDDGRTLADELATRRVVAEAIAAEEAGDAERADRLLRELHAARPGDPAAQTVWGALLLRRGRPDEALAIGRELLAARPYAPALGLAISAAWASDRLADLVPILEASPRAEAWVEREAALARFGLRVHHARADARAGRPGRARRALRELSPPALEVAARVRAWSLLGAAWAEVGDNRRAQAAYAEALALDPDDVDAAVSAARALHAAGRLAAALRLLEARFERDEDARVGAVLVRLQAEAGRWTDAKATAARLIRADAGSAPARPGGPATKARGGRRRTSGVEAPEPLPPLPLGALDAGAPVQEVDGDVSAVLGGASVGAVRADAPAPPAGEWLAWLDTTGDAAEAALITPPPAPGPGERAAVTALLRTGPVGEARLFAVAMPLARETDLGAGRLILEAVPAWAADGVEDDLTVGAAIGARTAESGAVRGDARVGFHAVMDGALDLVGHARAAWHRGPIGVALSGTRAPATQTRFGWAGDPAGESWAGRVLDNWAQLSLGVDGAGHFGVLGRVGALTGPGMPADAWRQGAAWARVPITVGAFALEPGAEGQVQAHDRAAERFVPDEAGVFTPVFAASVRAGAVATWTPSERLAICAGAAAGPHWTRAQAWFLAPDLQIGWGASVGAGWTVAPGLRLAVLGSYDDGAGGWDDAGVTVGLWRGAAGAAGAGPTFSSVTHAAPVREVGRCGGVAG